MHGLYLLWWVQERHLPVAVVASILAAGDLALVVLEVPTGWFADRCGHRVSLILGSLTQVFGMLLCWRGNSALALLAASLLVSLGDSFRSGADQALLYRSCAAVGREEDFQRIEARTRAVQLAALVALTVFGGAIVTRWGFAVGWMLETALSAIGLAIATAMIEPLPLQAAMVAITDASRQDEEGARRFSREPSSSVGPIVILVLPAAFLAAAASAASFLVQTMGGGRAERMSLFVALITLAEASGAACALQCPATGARTQFLIASSGLMCLAAAAAFPSGLAPIAVALSLLLGLAQPLRAAALQRMTADQMRARAASIASACDKALVTIALTLSGYSRRRR